MCQSFHTVYDDFPISRSRNFCRHSSSKVQSLAPHKSNPLILQKKKLARIMLPETKTLRLFISCCLHDMSLHGKLTAVASRWLVKVFFLKSNDVLDAVLSTDRGQQRCFNFLIRQFLSFKQCENSCSMTDKKPFVVCGFCSVTISPVIGYNTINIPDI